MDEQGMLMGLEAGASSEEIPAPLPEPEVQPAHQPEAEPAPTPPAQPDETLVHELYAHRAHAQAVSAWGNFFAAHPEVENYAALPIEVKSAVAAGESPENAYARHQVTVLRRELEALKQQQANRANAPGSVSSVGGEETDAFISGFMQNLRDR